MGLGACFGKGPGGAASVSGQKETWGKGPGEHVGAVGELDPEQTQHRVRFARVGTQLTGDVGHAEPAQEADGKVAQRRHDGGPVTRAHLTAVLVEGHVAHIVGAVLNRPVVAVELEEPLGVGVLGGERGDAVDDVELGFSGFEFCSLAFDAEDLCGVGEVQVGVQGGGGPDAADFEAPVSFLTGFSPEGGNAPKGGWRCPRGAWVGFL